MAILNNQKYFFQTRAFRIGITIVGVIVVLGLVVFSKQIGQLLDLFGSRASTEAPLMLNGNPGENNFLAPGYTAEPDQCFRIADGKLRLNPIGPTPSGPGCIVEE